MDSFDCLVMWSLLCFSPLSMTLSEPPEKSLHLPFDKYVEIQRTGQELQSSLMSELDPCTNFFWHVCLNCNGTSDDSANEMDIEEYLLNYLNTNKNISKAEVKLKSFIQSCKNGMDQNFPELVKKLKPFPSISDWPAYNTKWSGQNLDLNAIIAEFHPYISVILSWSFKVDPKTLRRYAFVTLQDFDLLTKRDNKDDLLRHLKAIGAYYADEIVSDAQFLENEVRKIFPECDDTLDMKTEFHLGSLRKEIPEIDWDKQIKIITGHELPDEFPVVIESAEGLRKVFSAVSVMDPRIIFNYFFCNFIHTVPHIETANSRMCMRYAIHTFTPVITKVITNNLLDPSYLDLLKGMIRSMEENHKYFVLPERLQFGPDGAMALFRTIRELYLPYTSTEVDNRMYSRLHIVPSNYPLNMLRMRLFVKEQQLKMLFNDELLQLLVLDNFLPSILPFKLHLIKNKPLSIIYESLITPVLFTYLGVMKEMPGFADAVTDCLENQIRPVTVQRSTVIDVIGAQILLKTYASWANTNRQMLETENKVLKRFNFNHEKILFTRMARSGCGNLGLDHMMQVLAVFWNEPQFSKTYNCGNETIMNKKEKCMFEMSRNFV